MRPNPSPAAHNDTDLPEATRIFRVAFGTFLGAPDPETFWSDRDYMHGRWHAPHVAAFGAKRDGNLLGSNFVTRWGSVGLFGPITVRPNLQNAGIAQALLTRTMEQFDAWGTTHTGWSRYSALSDTDKAAALAGYREVADSIYPGLDLTEEIRSAHAQGLGDTMLVEGHGRITAGMQTVLAGTNLARQESYEALAARGYRTAIQGVNMHRNNEPGYCRPGVYAIDDWR